MKSSAILSRTSVPSWRARPMPSRLSSITRMSTAASARTFAMYSRRFRSWLSTSGSPLWSFQGTSRPGSDPLPGMPLVYNTQDWFCNTSGAREPGKSRLPLLRSPEPRKHPPGFQRLTDRHPDPPARQITHTDPEPGRHLRRRHTDILGFPRQPDQRLIPVRHPHLRHHLVTRGTRRGVQVTHNVLAFLVCSSIVTHGLGHQPNRRFGPFTPPGPPVSVHQNATWPS